MRREVLIVLVLALLAQAAAAMDVTQSAPTSGQTLTSGDVLFSCAATDATPLTSIILNGNFTGTFQNNYTVAGTGIETSLAISYTVYNLPNGIYNWNCIAANSTWQQASANLTFTVNVPTPAFSGPIPNQTFSAGQTSSAFDLDTYFTNPSTFIVKGNSTVIVSIGADNSVILSAATAANETLNFTTGSASSNSILVQVTPASTLSCSAIANQTWLKNNNLTLTVHCTGASNITITSTTPPHITARIANGTATLTPETNWIGESSIKFTGTAGSMTASTNNITLIVTGLGSPPKIDAYLPSTTPQILAGGTQAFSITKSGNGTLTVKWYLDDTLVAGATGDSYTYSGATAGTHTIKAVVSDGTQESTQSWTMTVKAAALEPEAQVNTTSIIGEQSNQPECGDGTCEGTENCGNCKEDCTCANNQVCEKNACAAKTANKPAVVIVLTIAIILAGIGAGVYFYITRKPGDTQKKETSFEKIQVTPPAEITDFYQKQPEEKPAMKRENPVTSYISKMRAKGTKDEDIKKTLKAKGWSDQQIDQAFRTS